jgi:hypothetical protein
MTVQVRSQVFSDARTVPARLSDPPWGSGSRKALQGTVESAAQWLTERVGHGRVEPAMISRGTGPRIARPICSIAPIRGVMYGGISEVAGAPLARCKASARGASALRNPPRSDALSSTVVGSTELRGVVEAGEKRAPVTQCVIDPLSKSPPIFLNQADPQGQETPDRVPPPRGDLGTDPRQRYHLGPIASLRVSRARERGHHQGASVRHHPTGDVAPAGRAGRLARSVDGRGRGKSGALSRGKRPW